MIPVIGAALLLLLGADVFLTVFHPSGRGGPINRKQNRAVWGLFRLAGVRSDGTLRDGFLSLGGSTLIVLTLVVWVVWLVAGFALIYFPFIEGFLVSPGSLRTHWSEALYYSGYTAATLGLGDVIADTNALRLLTVVEAFCGFALLSVSVTYLLAVYRELITMHTLASRIAGYFGAGDVCGLVERQPDPPEAVARWGEDVTASLLHVLQAHHQYPILHYFRAREESRALPVQLGELLALRRAAKARPNHNGSEQPVATDLSLSSLSGALEQYIDQVNRRFVPGNISKRGIDQDSDDTEKAHLRLLHYMRYR